MNTYRRFGEMLSCLIQALEARGIRQGDSIAVLSANRPEAFLVNAASYVMGLRVTHGISQNASGECRLSAKLHRSRSVGTGRRQ